MYFCFPFSDADDLAGPCAALTFLPQTRHVHVTHLADFDRVSDRSRQMIPCSWNRVTDCVPSRLEAGPVNSVQVIRFQAFQSASCGRHIHVLKLFLLLPQDPCYAVSCRYAFAQATINFAVGRWRWSWRVTTILRGTVPRIGGEGILASRTS